MKKKEYKVGDIVFMNCKNRSQTKLGTCLAIINGRYNCNDPEIKIIKILKYVKVHCHIEDKFACNYKRKNKKPCCFIEKWDNIIILGNINKKNRKNKNVGTK